LFLGCQGSSFPEKMSLKLETLVFAAFPLLMQVEQLHCARVRFSYCIQKPFFGEVFLLGLPRLNFS
jgi:hypothetical protein